MLIDTLKNKYGQSALKWSALRNGGEDIIRDILKEIKPKVAVEIGTYKGLATILLSQYVEEVYTFDNQEFPIYDKRVNVNYIVCNNEEKKNKLELIDFDFAFIDGDHREGGVLFDFDCVKKCGRILLHDCFDVDNPKRASMNGAGILIEKLKEDNNWIIFRRDIFAYIERIDNV